MRRSCALVALLTCLVPLRAEEAKDKSVEKLAETVRPSIVVITAPGRDGKREGLGTGFVVSADGLIATNFHVIGEGRPITVELADGKRHPVTAVHAVDRAQDLAVVRIDVKELKPLEIGDSDGLKDGQDVVAIGNPRGLKRSVVAGVVSGRREIDGRNMIQLAIPIEQGNSGGPLLDRAGRVHGILTIKSLVTSNLGFAVPSKALKPLLAKPTPVPMSAWLTFGALDPDEWQPKLGAGWRQRAGRLLVDGPGTGFGGRSFCLYQRPVPEVPFEVTVTVRLDDESGAAGLIFHADGDDRHYGFYPTGGKLRLTRFDGPDVYTWKILKDAPSPHYRPGEWNTLRVRVEKGRIRCFVNDQLAIESDDAALTSGKVGLAKFRDTNAEFKQFRVGKEVPSLAPPADVATRVRKAVEKLPTGPAGPDVVGKLTPEGAVGLSALREQARQLEEQAVRLRRLALAVHQQAVLDDLQKTLAGKEEDIDLFRAALLLARLDNEEVDVEHYRTEVDRMAKKVAAGLPKGADDRAKLDALNQFLFKERGFHGSRLDYYNRSNSYLSEVIDDREGLPITLSVLYSEMARRLGLKVVGVGLPGHFVVRFHPAKGEPQLIDVFDGAKVLSKEDAAKRIEGATGRPPTDADLAATPKRAIVVRMLNNLLRVAGEEEDVAGSLRYLDAILTLAPDSVRERGMRAGLRYKAGDNAGATKDVDWLLEKMPEGLDLDAVREFRKLLAPKKD
jgi:regulator of sirC expression with transglutaminase-like and TPR domain